MVRVNGWLYARGLPTLSPAPLSPARSSVIGALERLSAVSRTFTREPDVTAQPSESAETHNPAQSAIASSSSLSFTAAQGSRRLAISVRALASAGIAAP